ncbi:MAG: MGMT family protein [Oscillospiraceae bacterium]|jgi:methylated-DNA-protein-cysteine methyltransferase-like protein|nr:MGMT family protein [Oscillospiraceae bacterium]
MGGLLFLAFFASVWNILKFVLIISFFVGIALLILYKPIIAIIKKHKRSKIMTPQESQTENTPYTVLPEFEIRPYNEPKNNTGGNNAMANASYARIYAEIRKIPRGRVATYSSIAEKVGTIARTVGTALGSNSDPTLPDHRVVKKSGAYGLANPNYPGGEAYQRSKLRSEGVYINGDGTIYLRRFGW